MNEDTHQDDFDLTDITYELIQWLLQHEPIDRQVIKLKDELIRRYPHQDCRGFQLSVCI